MIPEEEILSKAKEFGAVDARIVTSDRIIVAHWVRLKCQFGCPDYGKCKTCPPFTPDTNTMREILKEYQKVLLATSTSHDNATKLARDIMFWLYSRGIYKVFPLGSGRCRLCKVCNINNCPHPELAYPSMEACSIDVFGTARLNGISLSDPEGNPLHMCAVLLF